MDEKKVQPSSKLRLFANIAVGIGFGALILYLTTPHFDHQRATATRNECINNLRMIADAKNAWGLENGSKPGDIVRLAHISGFFRSNQVPQCSSRGVYTIGRVGESPKCSIPDHVLPP